MDSNNQQQQIELVRIAEHGRIELGKGSVILSDAALAVKQAREFELDYDKCEFFEILVIDNETGRIEFYSQKQRFVNYNRIQTEEENIYQCQTKH